MGHKDVFAKRGKGVLAANMGEIWPNLPTVTGNRMAFTAANSTRKKYGTTK
jgi:hypothetical protein